MGKLEKEMRRRLGPELTQKIFSCFAGQDLYVPVQPFLAAARRNRQIAALHMDGLSVSELSRRFGLSQRQVRRVVSGRGRFQRTAECLRKLEEALGVQGAERLAEAFPGASLYIPLTGKSAARAQRDADIRATFTGSNAAELARLYALSRRQIYTILKGGAHV